MESELLLKFIGYFPTTFRHCRVRFYASLDNLCRNSCINSYVELFLYSKVLKAALHNPHCGTVQHSITTREERCKQNSDALWASKVKELPQLNKMVLNYSLTNSWQIWRKSLNDHVHSSYRGGLEARVELGLVTQAHDAGSTGCWLGNPPCYWHSELACFPFSTFYVDDLNLPVSNKLFHPR